MPRKTGPEVFAELKNLGVPIPVIMLTSKNEVSDMALMLEKGVMEYILKPFTKDIILEKISMIKI